MFTFFLIYMTFCFIVCVNFLTVYNSLYKVKLLHGCKYVNQFYSFMCILHYAKYKDKTIYIISKMLRNSMHNESVYYCA